MRIRTPVAALLAFVASACGAPPTVGESDAPIINGTTYPTLVSLTPGEELAIVFLAHGTGDPFCSGTLVAPDVVLTASHCVRDQDLSTVKVGLGQPRASRARIGVRQSAIASWEYDAALLLLSDDATRLVPDAVPMPMNRAPLPSSLIGESVEASGYHMIGGETPLRKYGVLGVTNVLDQSVVCNGFGARGVCNGDSGGPLLATLDGETRLIGHTLGGNASCRDDSYFTRTDAMGAWLDATLADFARVRAQPKPIPSPSCADGGDFAGPLPIFGTLLLVAFRRRRWSARRAANRFAVRGVDSR